ncbi:MAG: pilus assembly protein [Chloroflexi bacterium]|nr:pilus assembly protein [Chloroflexota bacterium]
MSDLVKLSAEKRLTDPKTRGQSMVEMALSFTVIMFLLAGAVDLGRVFFSFIAIRDAAQEGAIYGSLFPTDVPGIFEHVQTSSSNPVDLTDTTAVQIQVSYTNPSGLCAGSDNGITVTVRYDFEFIMPLLGVMLPSQQIPIFASMTDTILRPMC